MRKVFTARARASRIAGAIQPPHLADLQCRRHGACCVVCHESAIEG